MHRPITAIITTFFFVTAAPAETIRLDCVVTSSKAFFGASTDGEVTAARTKRGDKASFDFSVLDGVIFVTYFQNDFEHQTRARVSWSGKFTTLVSRPDIQDANDEGGGTITLTNDSISIGSSWFRTDPANSPKWPNKGWTVSMRVEDSTPSGTVILSDETQRGLHGGYMEIDSVECANGLKSYRALEQALWSEFSTRVQ